MVRGIRHNALALVAIFIALGGVAFAVTKAPKNSVVSKSIKDGQVKPRDTRVVRFARAPGEAVVDQGEEVDLKPRVTVKARAGDVLRVHVAVTMRLGGSLSNDCLVKLRVKGPPGDFDRFVLDANPSDPVTLYMDGSSDGTTNLADLIGRDVPISQSGNYTISMRYSSGVGGDRCVFSGRRIWLEHSR